MANFDMKDGLCDLLKFIGIYPGGVSFSFEENCIPAVSIDGSISTDRVIAAHRQLIAEEEYRRFFDILNGVGRAKKATDKTGFQPRKILKNGDYMTVLWEDGTRTTVKRSAEEPESDYAAFTAALGIKVFGSNSALKRVVAGAEPQKKKKRK